ncbi:MAG: glutamine-hydrolyzing GMP synthase [Gammaproteobacteria bacterium]|nr:glutamine-hydrolyzing GMP synthase [Gammaproteobacteria bacterium]
MKINKPNCILILDFGSQYTQLIARRIREMDVYCEIYSYGIDNQVLHQHAWCGVILSGGPKSVLDKNSPQIPEWLLASSLPILGICYGMQALAYQLGGTVAASTIREFGHAEIKIHPTDGFLSHLSNKLDVWMSHGDHVTALPEGFKTLAKTRDIPIAIMANPEKHWYGLQFHPEVTHTSKGIEILKSFVLGICNATPNWTAAHILDATTHSIQEAVGSEHVLLALSGGVDSSVVAALLHRAIGNQLHAVFVDTGLLRLGEAEAVEETFSEKQGINFTKIDASSKFLTALAGKTCPEEKRKIIGILFIDVFEEAARHIPNISWLAQGTIYPDVIESAGIKGQSNAELIKSHHNVGGLPEHLPFKLLEPIRALFKDEVRILGEKLALPHARLYQHPFPGPGLAVRILGEVKPEYAEILRKADAIFIKALHKANLYYAVSQAFAVFLPVKSVGVMGDGRRYDPVICLRAVETQDFMTAHWAKLPWDFLDQVSHQIINEVPGISRVTYDISGKPPATIEWE